MHFIFKNRIIERRFLDHAYVRENPETKGEFEFVTDHNGEVLVLKGGFTAKADAETYYDGLMDKLIASEGFEVIDGR